MLAEATQDLPQLLQNQLRIQTTRTNLQKVTISIRGTNLEILSSFDLIITTSMVQSDNKSMSVSKQVENEYATLAAIISETLRLRCGTELANRSFMIMRIEKLLITRCCCICPTLAVRIGSSSQSCAAGCAWAQKWCGRVWACGRVWTTLCYLCQQLCLHAHGGCVIWENTSSKGAILEF